MCLQHYRKYRWNSLTMPMRPHLLRLAATWNSGAKRLVDRSTRTSHFIGEAWLHEAHGVSAGRMHNDASRLCHRDCARPYWCCHIGWRPARGSCSHRSRSVCRACPDAFEAAWQAFRTTPNMSKAETLPEWKKLTPDDRATVLPSIAGYREFLEANPTPAHPFLPVSQQATVRGFRRGRCSGRNREDLADPVGLGPWQASVAGTPVGSDPWSTWLSGSRRPPPARRRTAGRKRGRHDSDGTSPRLRDYFVSSSLRCLR